MGDGRTIAADSVAGA